MSAVALVLGAVSGAVIAADPTTKAGSPPPITFVVTAVFALAVILLGLDLVRRVRRAQFKAEIHESLADEIAERDAAAQAGPGAAQATSGDAAPPVDGDPAPGSTDKG